MRGTTAAPSRRSSYAVHEIHCASCREPVADAAAPCPRCGRTGAREVVVRVTDADHKVNAGSPPSDPRESELIILLNAEIEEEKGGIHGLVQSVAMKLEAKHSGRGTVADRHLRNVSPELRERLAAPGGFDLVVGVVEPSGRYDDRGRAIYDVVQESLAGLSPQESRAIHLGERLRGDVARYPLREIAFHMDRARLNRRQLAMFREQGELPRVSVSTVDELLSRAWKKLHAYGEALSQGGVA